MRHSVGSEYHQQDWDIKQVSKLNEILGFAAMVSVLSGLALILLLAVMS